MPIDCRTESNGRLRHILTIDQHTLYADLSISSGGEGSAPGPHDYFDAALAACKSTTAMLYARSHGWKLDRVNVHIDRDDSNERQGTYVLRVKVGFEGALSEQAHDDGDDRHSDVVLIGASQRAGGSRVPGG